MPTADAESPAYIGLGANLGDAPATVHAALRALAGLPGSRLQQASSLYRSAPVQARGPDFYNAAALLHTCLSPQALLTQLQAIEQQFGRQRPYANAPRTLDLDLLLYGNRMIQTPALTVPHPRLHQRAFVLLPLLELSPALHAPGLGALSQWLAATTTQAIEKVPMPSR